MKLLNYFFIIKNLLPSPRYSTIKEGFCLSRLYYLIELDTNFSRNSYLPLKHDTKYEFSKKLRSSGSSIIIPAGQYPAEKGPVAGRFRKVRTFTFYSRGEVWRSSKEVGGWMWRKSKVYKKRK